MNYKIFVVNKDKALCDYTLNGTTIEDIVKTNFKGDDKINIITDEKKGIKIIYSLYSTLHLEIIEI